MTTRYSKSLVTVHWVSAALIIGALGLGLGVLTDMPNSNPEKVGLLKIHLGVGAVLLVLLLLRIVLRLRKPVPPSDHFESPLLNRLGRAMHFGLYLLVAGVLLSGVGLAAVSELPALIFQQTGELPADFEQFKPHNAHAVLSRILAVALVLHVLAAVYHQFVRRDSIFKRMWFGKN